MKDELFEEVLEVLYETAQHWQDKAQRFIEAWGAEEGSHYSGVAEGLLRAASILQAAKQGLDFHDL